MRSLLDCEWFQIFSFLLYLRYLDSTNHSHTHYNECECKYWCRIPMKEKQNREEKTIDGNWKTCEEWALFGHKSCEAVGAGADK